MVGRVAALASGFLLIGCLEIPKPDPASLNSVSTAPPAIPDCAGCHAYPLHDVNHTYHLRAFNTREGVQAKFIYERKNGVIVCMDCHFGSVAHRNYVWFDTIWGTDGDLRSSADKLPNDPWGHPYQYLNPGIKGEIDVLSLGADGQPGGEGINADIGNWNLDQ